MGNFVKYSDLVRGGGRNHDDYEKVGKVTTDSVFKHTDKHWKQWIGILEKAGARSWTYQEIVAYLNKKYRLTPWWQQGVALGFEIATGRRKEGQDAKGKYMVTATKSLPIGVQEVWKFVVSSEGQQIWLKPLSDFEVKPKSQFETSDGFFGEVRTMAKTRRVRLYWQDPLWEKHTVLELMMVPRPGKKSILIFNHTGILDTKTKGLLQSRWRKAADEIAQRFIESPPRKRGGESD